MASIEAPFELGDSFQSTRSPPCHHVGREVELNSSRRPTLQIVGQAVVLLRFVHHLVEIALLLDGTLQRFTFTHNHLVQPDPGQRSTMAHPRLLQVQHRHRRLERNVRIVAAHQSVEVLQCLQKQVAIGLASLVGCRWFVDQ
jgi:hypothetical protein